MMFQSHKFHTRTGTGIFEAQQGVSLLLAILILSSILAISFSLAAILTVEIRSSGDLLKTEPSFYAAQAVTEEALFALRRQIPSFPYTTALNGISLESSPSLVHDPIQQVSIPSTANTFSATTNRYALYDPSDLYGGSDYARLEISFLNTGNGGTLHIYICQFDATLPYDCTSPGSSDFSVARDATLSEGFTAPMYSLDASMQQEIVLFVTGATSDAYVQLKTFGPFDISLGIYPPKGIPALGESLVDISASAAGISRKVRTSVPHGAP